MFRGDPLRARAGRRVRHRTVTGAKPAAGLGRHVETSQHMLVKRRSGVKRVSADRPCVRPRKAVVIAKFVILSRRRSGCPLQDAGARRAASGQGDQPPPLGAGDPFAGRVGHAAVATKPLTFQACSCEHTTPGPVAVARGGPPHRVEFVSRCSARRPHRPTHRTTGCTDLPPRLIRDKRKGPKTGR